MHISGKILVWVVVVGALAAVALTGKLYDVQNTWAREVDKLRQQNEQNARAIAEKTAVLRRLQSEFDQEMAGWGPYWNNVATGVRADGVLRGQGLGGNQGFGFPAPQDRPEAPVAFAFRQEQDGGATYIGVFRATQVREDESELHPDFLLREGEAQDWAGNPAWRFRAQVPAPWKNRSSDLRSTLLLAYDRLAQKELYLADQTDLQQSAQEHLDARRAELLGADDKPGLVALIETEEEARNEALEELDRLRRQVKSAYDAIRQTVEKNGRLARSLALPTDRAAAR